MNKSNAGELELLRLYRGLNRVGRDGLLIVARTFGHDEQFKVGTDFDEYQRGTKGKAAGEVDEAGAGHFLRLVGDVNV